MGGAMFCPRCGQQNQDDAAFCLRCAASLQSPSEVSPPAQRPVGHAETASGYPPAPEAVAPAATPRESFNTSRLFFMSRVIDYVSHGSLFRKIVAGYLVVGAVITVLAGLTATVLALMAFVDYGGLAILGGVLTIPVVLIGTYMLSHTMLIRARTVRAIPDSEYTVIPIVSILFKLTGELALIGCTVTGVWAMLTTWFLGSSPLGMYGGYGMGGGEAFIFGVLALVAMVVYGFVALLLSYLMSELVVVVADIARDLRVIRHAQAGDTPVDAG